MAVRTSLLAGVGAAFAAALLLASCDQAQNAELASAATSDAAVAAVVNGEPIYVSDVNNESDEKLEVDSAEFNDVLDGLIDFKLMAQEAASRGLDGDPLARHRLARARETILGQILIEAKVAERVDESAIKKMYDSQIAIWELGEEAHVRHILAPTKEAIDKIAAELKGGADFAVLASRKSTDEESKMEGGDLGYMKADNTPPEFAKVVRDTPTGGVSKPFQTDLGWHIVKIDERRKEQPPSLEELRPRILEHLTRVQIGEVMKELRGKAKIEKRTSPRNSTLEVDPFDQPEQPDAKPALGSPLQSFEASTPQPPADAREAGAAAKPAPPPPSASVAAKPPAAAAKPPAAPAQPAIQPSGPVSESRQPQ